MNNIEWKFCTCACCAPDIEISDETNVTLHTFSVVTPTHHWAESSLILSLGDLVSSWVTVDDTVRSSMLTTIKKNKGEIQPRTNHSIHFNQGFIKGLNLWVWMTKNKWTPHSSTILLWTHCAVPICVYNMLFVCQALLKVVMCTCWQIFGRLDMEWTTAMQVVMI